MTGSEILTAVLKSVNTNANEFAKEIGLSKTQNLYDIRDGKIKKISSDLASKIINRYPQFNLQYLISGEGQMLKSRPEADSSKNLVNDSDMNDVYANHKQKALANESATTDLQPLTMQAILKLVDNTHMLASANKTLVETNSRLANRVLAEPGHAPEQTQSIFETKSREILELLSQALVDGKKYKTVEEADAYVHNMLFGKPKKIASEGIQNG